MPRTQIFPDRSDNYRSSTTDQQNRQLFSTRTARWVIGEPQPAIVELAGAPRV